MEKINGVNYREKFRIRLYNMNTNVIHLEKKSKVNGLCWKESIQLTVEETKKILHGDYGFMRNGPRPLLTELYSKILSQQLKPKTIVDYDREPFIFKAGNVRITSDRNIRTGLFSTDLFNPQLPTIAAGDELVILEVKYDRFIPQHIVQLLQLGDRRASACSKYALARIYG